MFRLLDKQAFDANRKQLADVGELQQHADRSSCR